MALESYARGIAVLLIVCVRLLAISLLFIINPILAIAINIFLDDIDGAFFKYLLKYSAQRYQDIDKILDFAYYIGLRSHWSEARVPGALVAEVPDYDLVLFRNPIPAKPRAYLSQHPERSDSPVDPAALLARPDFLSGEVDVIETTNSILPGPSPNGTATIERYRPEEVRVRVDTPQPALLVLLDAFDDGWRATLDNGSEIPIMRANTLVRAVAVPTGRHMVTFSYHTPLLEIGAWASLAGVLLSAGLLVPTRWRTRHRKTRA